MNVIEQAHGDNWVSYNGDSTEVLQEMPENSIDGSVMSPPFESLFTYSASERDLGNCRTDDEFYTQYGFILDQMYRVTKPGRLTCVHTMDLPAMMMKDGYVGLKDFPGDVIRAHIERGWIFHGRITLDDNPQSQALRTKAKALLFAQMEKDSSESRPCIGDQILIFKKPGENKVPIRPVENKEITRMDWILWARAIWYASDYEPGTFDPNTAEKTQKSGMPSEHGIRKTETLQYTTARDPSDEKHVCPMALGTIERCIKLYSNPGETILDPFAGIGSTGYQAIRFGRKAVCIELKPSYYKVNVRNLQEIESQVKASNLFVNAGITL